VAAVSEKAACARVAMSGELSGWLFSGSGVLGVGA
jgi:hypothetical protein